MLDERAMTTVNALARTAAAIGEPARAAMLLTLLDGRAYTAGELARAAGVTPPTASAHLAMLVEAGLLAVVRQGRHRYHRLASPRVAAMLEGMLAVDGALPAATPPVVGPRDRALRRARRCYDHLAGEIAVGIADALEGAGELRLEAESAALNDAGLERLAQLGVTPPARATLCRPCLDWSERRPHLAGAVGTALLDAMVARHWLYPGEGRALAVSPAGAAGLERVFGLRV